MEKQATLILAGGYGALGQVVAQVAQANGYAVALLGHRPADAVSSSTCLALDVDLCDEDAVKQVLAQVHQQFGSIDALVNVAGAFAYARFGDSDAALWDKMFRSNVLTSVVTSRAVLPYFQQQKRGRIVFMGAKSATSGQPGMSAYTAAKSALARLTEALAEEVKADGITVNALLPTIIDTPANRRDMPNADFNSWVKPETLAHAMLSLMAGDAAFQTGSLIPMTGG
ncbi:SDR family NAD(P)-dependent oxidoreductase [Leeia oryzae]|uniref:SDR family NAD(P)-dependent oxidoreductase n=1 Tax=Leeia oryzae TaxID=356662 RepID=UPI00036C417A|nr:SDR family NAD(P)-dependent oxidoreductase [Leeia oryzae]